MRIKQAIGEQIASRSKLVGTNPSNFLPLGGPAKVASTRRLGVQSTDNVAREIRASPFQFGTS